MRGQRMNKYSSCRLSLRKHWACKYAFLIPIEAYRTRFGGRPHTSMYWASAPCKYDKPHPPQTVLVQVMLRSKSLSVSFRERAKLQHGDTSVGDLATGNACDSLAWAPAHSANWQPICAITCAFIEVLTMSDFRFRVVLCAYERYIIPLYT